MLRQIKNIVLGWFMFLLKFKKTEAAKRLDICHGCIYGAKNKIEQWDNSCKICGCFMPAKVLVDNESCPDGKW